MGARFSKGTMDHDGDGKPGGSLSRAEAERRAAEQKENDMAKQPTAKNADKPAPSQPWAKPAAETAANAPATNGETPQEQEPTQEPADEIPPVIIDQHADLQERIEALSDDETAEFNAFMTTQAIAKLDQIEKGRKAREFSANLVDPSEHYGNKIPTPRRKELEA